MEKNTSNTYELVSSSEAALKNKRNLTFIRQARLSS